MIWIIYILSDAFANYYMIEVRQTKPFYLILFLVRGIAAILYGAFILDVQPDVYSFLKWCVVTIAPFPFVFNSTLNLMRGKPIIYFGKESGWIDSFVAKNNLQNVYFYVTVALFLISLTFIR